MSADLLAAQVALEERDDLTAYQRLMEGLRLSVRKGQLDLIANPDPSSPWWFLVDPDAEFVP